ncbi:MAG: VWA domain-containing protein [Spirochaetes bacterium]|nr:VWA domain-containing protein [Spirochaetota bacterium]
MSMKEEMPYFQKKYPVIKKKLLKKIKYLRMALIFYRDYGERFLTKVYDFTDDQNYIDYLIGRIYIDGGDDIPEALYEGIAELANLNFQSSNRIAFLIGDAPAHPKPRGNITRENAVRVLNESKVKLHTICFPFR